MNVPSFVGDSILGRFSLREKDGPGLLLPRGNFMLYPFSGRKSNTDQFFQEGGGDFIWRGVYATTPVRSNLRNVCIFCIICIILSRQTNYYQNLMVKYIYKEKCAFLDTRWQVYYRNLKIGKWGRDQNSVNKEHRTVSDKLDERCNA